MAKKEVFLYGIIGPPFQGAEMFFDGILTDKSFNADMDEAEAGTDDILVRINSPGGSTFHGIAIHNRIALSPHRNRITCRNDGIAYSMAADILLAGNKSEALENSTTLLHSARGFAEGTAKDMEDCAEMLHKLDGAQAITVASKTGQTEEEVKAKWFDGRDHTMSAKEAFDAGLIDTVIPIRAQNIPENVSAMSMAEVFAFYAKIDKPGEKKGFFNQMKAIVQDVFASHKSKITNTPEDMKIPILAEHKAVAAVLGLTFNDGETSKEVELTPEHITALQAKLNDLDAQATAAKTAEDAAKNNLATAIAKIANLEEIIAKTPGAEKRAPVIKDENHDTNQKHPEAIAEGDPIQAIANSALKNT